MKMIKKIHNYTLGILLLVVALSSCKTSQQIGTRQLSKESITSTTTKLNEAKYGVSRIKEYTLVHADIPKGFDGKTILFLSDTHYPSLFRRSQLNSFIRLLDSLSFDILCLGGDYHEDAGLIDTLFDALGTVVPPLGAYAVLGNNDYERAYEQVVQAMKRNNIQLLEHKVAKVKLAKSALYIAGVRNPFDLKENGVSPTLSLDERDFVLLLTHTPDYAEDVSIAHTDLVLAGHTHGGQVRIFGVAPIVPSKYDQRFLTGLVYNTAGIPMIVTNGIGTSNKNVRIGAPSELVLIHLRSMY